MNVEVISVGTELLLGQIVNTNLATIGAALAEAGIDSYRQTVVGDNLDRLADAIRESLSRSDAVVLTGGIGPTQDDLTREAICAATGLEMAFDEEYAAHLKRWWESRRRGMPPTNFKQAEHPAGATLIPNEKGTAPGLDITHDGKRIFAMPGVPAEMVLMLRRHVVPALVSAGGEQGVLKSRVLRSYGLPESKVAELLADLFEEYSNPTIAFLASAGEIKIRLTAKGDDRAGADALIAPVEAEVRARLGQHIFGADEDTVEKIIFEALATRGWSVGTAESATGGMIAARLTSVPGASDHYRGSVVAYATDLKRGLLSVSADALATGVVSEETAIAMAEGAREALDVDVAVAVTGSAGPDPQDQPAGTMVVAVVTPLDRAVQTLRLPGDRERVRTYTTTAALQMLRAALVD
jgi:nicotinamide-nucleotide amidase